MADAPRVVLDTNVLVSGLLWTGLPHDLIAAAEAGRLRVVATSTILDELARTLARPKFAPRITALETSIAELMVAAGSLVELIEAPPVAAVVRADPDDDEFLAVARAARALCIVSGDRHLLELGEFEGVPILTPAAFTSRWRHLVRPR